MFKSAVANTFLQTYDWKINGKIALDSVDIQKKNQIYNVEGLLDIKKDTQNFLPAWNW